MGFFNTLLKSIDDYGLLNFFKKSSTNKMDAVEEQTENDISVSESGKCERLDRLPEELKRAIAKKLPTRDLIYFSQTSKPFLHSFKPLVNVPKLLHHVVRGHHNAVESILTENISALFKRDSVTDCSGREFENISAFEYALWALDKHMWEKMIACVAKNKNAQQIFKELMNQYDEVITQKVTYKLNGKTISEQHYDFAIINQLQTQLDSMNAPGNQNWDAIDKQWVEGVGGEQKLLPMHIVDQYCSDESFDPVPKFTSPPKSSRQFYYWGTRKYENWFSADSKLSVDFAIYKGAYAGKGEGARAARGRGRYACRRDLVAITALGKVRTNDFSDLKSQLEYHMTLDNHHQVPRI